MNKENNQYNKRMKINIVVPCYNEQEVLEDTIEVLSKLSIQIKQETDTEALILFVDDGSKEI